MTTDQSPMHNGPTELRDATSAVILLPNNPSFAHVSSGLALFLSLEKLGKTVEIACPSQMLVEVNRLVGVQRIKTKLSGHNLVISFDYVKDAIEKVSYNVEQGKFNLVVIPKNGHAPLDHENVKYSYAGTSGDFMILMGTRDTKEVEGLLHSDIGGSNVMALVSAPDRTLTSEVALVISSLNVTPDIDIANNLFAGLVKETHNFTHASAIDFETAAALVRVGASIQTDAPMVQSQVSSPEYQTINPDWLKQPKIFRAGEGQQ